MKNKMIEVMSGVKGQTALKLAGVAMAVLTLAGAGFGMQPCDTPILPG